MKGKDWFVVGARLIGLWQWTDAFLELLHIVAKLARWEPGTQRPISYSLLYAFGYIIIGYALLFFTDGLAALVWDRPLAQEDEKEEPSEPF